MLLRRLGLQTGCIWLTAFLVSTLAWAAGEQEMGMRKIVIIRHAQSLGNAERRYSTSPANSGYFLAPLTELGKAQAVQLTTDLREAGYNSTNIAAVISSSLPRAVETAEIVVDGLGLDSDVLHIDDRIIERNFGQRDGMYYAQFDEKDLWYPENPESFQGETDQQIRDRMTAAWKDMSRWEKPGHILLISHGQPIHSLTAHLTGHGERISNATFIEFLTDGTRYEADGSPLQLDAASPR